MKNLAIAHLPSAVFDRRVEIVCLLTATMTNPQGDPECDNSSRVDANGYPFITPQGFRRKIRDLMSLRGEPIYIARKAVLATQLQDAITSVGLDASNLAADDDDAEVAEEEVEDAPKKKGGKKAKPSNAKKKLTSEDKESVVRALAKKYADIRIFGDVLTAPINEPIHGPIQFGYGMGVDPVTVQEMSITRVAVTKAEEAYKERTMGRNYVIPFALFRLEISINPFNAQRTGMTWGDYTQFLEDLQNMFELSKSGGRFGMAVEKIVVFEHDSMYGNSAAHKLFRRVTTTRNNPKGLLEEELPAARKPEDYIIAVNDQDLPKGITVRIID